ncbi:MAG TPA: type 4a pilus biogenesis protein PilO [Methylomirabilota bacterium]|jgi:type IV pilus assembly protein PilO|nr:type 4a pilus biogenesis protein PilO [Methylomirabilota bacterium]
MATFDIKSPGAQKLLLAILLAGGAVGVYFGTHLLPWTFPSGSEKIAELKSQYEQKSAELARARASVADLPRFEAEYDQLHQRWEMASELLPTERQLPTLLRKITLAGQQTGVTFTMFRPGAVQPSDYHTEMPIAVSVAGDYHSVGSFLAELANMRRIVTVSNLKLTTNNKNDGTGSTVAEFTASAYSLNTAPAATTATASTGSTPSGAAPAADQKKGDKNGRKS